MAGKIYHAAETKVTFKGSGGNVLLTFASTAAGALAVSAQYDRGAGSKPGLHRWRAKMRQVVTTATIGNTVWLYLIQTDDATDIPGRVGASDTEIASASNLLRNFGEPFGTVTTDTGTVEDMIATGLCWINSRYISIGVYNAMSESLSSTESDCYFELVAIPQERQ